MSIKLAIAGNPSIELHDETITLGSDPGCTIPLISIPDVKPNHVVIRSIDGNWVIEVREAESFFVGGTVAKKAHWIKTGDVIGLSKNGPAVKFELPVEESLKAEPPLKLAADTGATKSTTSDVPTSSDRNGNGKAPITKTAEAQANPPTKIPQTKNPSSAAIKTQSSSSIPTPKPVKCQTSFFSPTVIPPSR